MKWNEMTRIRKIALVICVSCAIVGFGLALLYISDGSSRIKKVNEIIDVVFWSSGAIAFYKKGSLFFIFNLTMSVISLIFVFL